MVNSINVLIIEDSESDYDLILYHLSKMDYFVTSERVENAVCLKAALEKLDWDIIISDYSLPSFSAPEALTILQERKSDIPFIVISGTITEETAISLMRSGAADYLMKDRLARLGPLVKRELSIAQVRRDRSEAQAALQKSYEWSELIYNSTSDSMFLLEVESNDIYRCLTVNAAYLSSTGLSENQVVGKKADEVLSPHIAQYVLSKYQAAIDAGHAIRYEESADLPRGMVTVETTLTPIMDQNGHCTHLLGSSHEITDRKQSEQILRESEYKYRSIAENSFDLIALLDLQGCYLYCNNSFDSILGYSPKELIGRSGLDIIHPDERAELVLHLENVLANKHTIQWVAEQKFVNRIRHRDGSYKWVEHRFRILEDEKGAPQQILLNAQDIDKRKHAEDALSESEERNRLLVERLNAGLVIHAPDTSIIYSNPEAQRLLGLSATEMNGKQGSDPGWKFFHEDGTVLSLNEYPVHRVINALEPIKNFVCGVYRYCSNDMIWAVVNGYPLFDSNHKINQVVITFVDITERKQAVDALAKGEQHYRSLFNYSSIAIWELDLSDIGFHFDKLRASGVKDFSEYFKDHPDEVQQCANKIKFLDVNPSSIALLRADTKENLYNNLYTLFINETIQGFLNTLIAISEGKNSLEIEIPIRTFTNDKIILDCKFVVSQEGKRDLSRVLGYFTDITQRRQAENILKESLVKLELLFDILPVGVSVLDQDRKLVKSNSALRDILDISEDGLLRGDYRNRRYFKPDGSPMPSEEYASSRVFNGENAVHHVETGIEKEDGSMVWTDVCATACELQDWNTVIVTAEITSLIETQKRNQQLLMELDRLIQEQKSIIRLSAQLRLEQDLVDAQKFLVDQALEMFSVSAAALFLVTEDVFEIGACSGEWMSWSINNHPIKSVVFNNVLDSKYPESFDSIDELDGLFPINNYDENGVGNFLSLSTIPIFSGDTPIGLLLMGSNTSKESLESQKNLMVTFAEIAGITLQRMKSVRYSDQLVSRRSRELSALYNVISTAGLKKTLIDKLDTSLGETLRSLDCSHGGVFLFDRERNRIITAVSQNFPHDLKDPIENAPLETSWEGWIITHKQVLVIPDISEDPRFIGANHLYIDQHLTYAGMPIINNGEVIGVLSLLRKGGQVFSIDELSFIHALANHISVIIENDHLIEQAEKSALLEERSRLARDLHDSVTQTLYSSAFFAETGLKFLDQGNLEKAKELLNRLSKISQQALKEMRLLIFQLRPEILKSEGLIQALRQRLELVENKVAIQTQMTVNFNQRVDDSVEDALYWAAIEALNNILKHAQASHILLQIQMETNRVILTIQDNGIGFNPQKTAGHSGMGLKNIQERVKMVGGSVEISSRQNQGTTLTIICPIMK